MNINRQSGRRRGRGGGGRSPNNAPNLGNRQDNRQRGNASQLHEKYKAMARDAQLAGDRVQTEYYLQFADHYFRILNENRARFEEQRRQRDDYSSDEDEGEDEVMAQDGSDERSDGRGDRYESEPRQEREPRQDREARQERGPRPDREVRQDREPRRDREERPNREYRADRDQRNGERRPNREAVGEEESGEAGDQIALESLPPSIAGDADKAPRRRTRRPRPEAPEADIAPAA